jgi:flagellin-like protein
MKTKKSQSEIITTVLLVLVALAAIAVIAMFIIGQVRNNIDTAESKNNCMKVDFAITKAAVNSSANATVTIQRLDDGKITVNNLSITVDGTSKNITSMSLVPTPLSTKEVTVGPLATGNKVELAVVLADGTVCIKTNKIV